ncbi:aldehyde ferredoxin oxidoreductase N-terminal domain-containing protein [Paludibacterium yongneupense]|uniref:aldehyde ferredoxin oxidoreductase N-terminal domain-containing protein n=1 Tax=Paludibacterium yongneupense TaxID=400061 RepID=UPI0004038E72|nr:aldehyde ferredoxin oxidoreductase N-terminal domain-containing protein [Paludibacterium yongneupense]
MDRIVRIDMAELSARIEPIPEAWHLLGGHTLTSSIVAAEVPPASHAFDASNRLVFAPGMLTGTAAAKVGRLSVGAKSPVSGGIEESNTGTAAARMLARLGVKALIIEGAPRHDRWYHIHITKDAIVIEEEDELVGKGNCCLVNRVQARLGKPAGIISIGPVGEMKMLSATLAVHGAENGLHALGRGGLGAVMGAKRLKYIALDDSDTPPLMPRDAASFMLSARHFALALLDHPDSGRILPDSAARILVELLDETGGRFHPALAASARFKEASRTVPGRRHPLPPYGCRPDCRLACTPVYDTTHRRHIAPGFEYEALWRMQEGDAQETADHIATADHIMDDIGCDALSVALAIAAAMERGALPAGDGGAVIQTLRQEVARGTGLGRRLGAGVVYTAKPAGEHEGHARRLRIATAAVDSTGICLFIGLPAVNIPTGLAALTGMINARFNLELGRGDVALHAQTVLAKERRFNLAASRPPAQDDRPERYEWNAPPPPAAVWDASSGWAESFWTF